MKWIKSYTEAINEDKKQYDLNKRFIDAATRDELEETARLLDLGADPNFINLRGRTALTHAAWYNRFEMMKLLLERGADPNLPDLNSSVPLHWAARSGSLRAAEMLLDRGADPNIIDGDGNSALDLAWLYGHPEMAKIIIIAGGDAFKTFKGPDEILSFFRGDVDWMPVDLLAKIQRIKKTNRIFRR